jgi:hypothetical protein
MPFIRKGIDLFDPKKIKLILRKNARGGTLRDWERILPAERDRLRRDLQLSNEDAPVIAMSDVGNPLAVTTRDIIWRSEGVSQRLQLDEIRRVDAPGFDISDKASLHQLSLTTNGGQSFILEVPKGESFFVVWNFLRGLFNGPRQ